MKIKLNQARASILAVFLGCLAFGARGAVQVMRFDPPLQISAYANVSGDSPVNVLGVDFDADGEVDFRLGYGMGFMSAFFNFPTRFGQPVPQPNAQGGFGPVGGVPLGSSIGTNIVSPMTSFYAWSSGYTNRDDLTQPLGDHESTVIIAGLVTFNQLGGPTISFSNGILVTNFVIPFPPVSGDVTYKEGVMAVEFYRDGQPHYGYIHFDFHNGASGVIYGWAYETEPNVAITARSLAVDLTPPSGIVGEVRRGNLPAPGSTVSIVPRNGAPATSVPTDPDGHFKVDLKPGIYTIRAVTYLPLPIYGQPFPNSVINGPAKTVRVIPNHFGPVLLRTSSGVAAVPLSEP